MWAKTPLSCLPLNSECPEKSLAQSRHSTNISQVKGPCEIRAPILIPFYRRRTWGLVTLGDLPKVNEVGGKERIWVTITPGVTGCRLILFITKQTEIHPMNRVKCPAHYYPHVHPLYRTWPRKQRGTKQCRMWISTTVWITVWKYLLKLN